MGFCTYLNYVTAVRVLVIVIANDGLSLRSVSCGNIQSAFSSFLIAVRKQEMWVYRYVHGLAY